MRKIIDIKNNIYYNYIFILIKSFDLTHGMWMIYFFSKGLTLFQLGILEGVFHLTSFVMETPTGVIADIFGRKVSRILGRLMYLIYVIIALVSNDFYLIIIGFICIAISYNLESGAHEALIYDSLIEEEKESKYLKVSGNNEVIYQISGAIALIMGGYIAFRDYEAIYKIMFIIMSLSIIFLLLMKETTINKENDKLNFVKQLKKQYITSFQVIKGKNKILFLIIIMNSMSAFVTVAFYYLQNYWKEMDYTEYHIGIFLALHGIFAAIGGLLAHKLEPILKEHKILLYIPFLIVIMLWGLINSITSIGAFMLLGTLETIFFIVLSDYINKLIPSQQRATIISFSSMIFSMFMILIFPLFGYIGDSVDIQTSFILLAILGTLFYIVYFIGYNNQIKTKNIESKNR